MRAIAKNNFMPLDFYAMIVYIRIRFWPSVDGSAVPAYTLADEVCDHHQITISSEYSIDARCMMWCVWYIKVNVLIIGKRIAILYSVFNSMHNEFTHPHTRTFHVKTIVNCDHKTLSLPFDGIIHYRNLLLWYYVYSTSSKTFSNPTINQRTFKLSWKETKIHVWWNSWVLQSLPRFCSFFFFWILSSLLMTRLFFSIFLASHKF